MLSNYVKVSYRNLVKYKSFSLINILGLSVGLACVVFIAMFVINEMSFDRNFFNADKIYRVGVKGNINGVQIDQAVTAAPMAAAILNENPKVLFVTRIARFGDWLVRYNNNKFNEHNFLFTDSSFFDVFSIPMIMGDPKQALTKPKSMVITEQTAKRYFGNRYPIGKMLRIESDSTFYEVTGVVRVPMNIHFKFDFLGSLSTFSNLDQQGWLIHNCFTYLLIDQGYSKDELTTDLNKLVPKYVAPEIEKIVGNSMGDFSKVGNNFEYFVQPLVDIHLHSNLQVELSSNGDARYIYIFIFVGVLLLIIASINFMNLAAARASNRAKEVGLRKVLGSDTTQLISQFLLETIFLSFIALLLALVMVEIFTPEYQLLVNRHLSLNMFLQPRYIIGLIFITIITGILAGSYPAFVLSSYKPVRTLKGDLRTNKQSPLLRNVLVVTQFASSIFIILCTFAVYRQLNYMTNHDLGFAKQQVVVINRSDGLRYKIEDFKKTLLNNSEVIGVANTTHVPGKVYWNNAFFTEENPNTTHLLYQSIVSPEVAKVLDLKLYQGRFFSAIIPGDTFACVLNQTAVKSLKLQHPVGKTLYQPVGDKRIAFKIIGVVDDFNFKSLHHPIEPMVMTFMRRNIDGYVIVRIHTNNIDKTIDAIKKTWNGFTSDYPFDYFWLNEDFNRLYSSERLTASVFSNFSLLSILIACLGLYGLIAYTAVRRTREIGIRKTLGASFSTIVLMLTKDTIRLILISLLIAWPVAYFVIRQWLKGFTYHNNINYKDFIFAALIAFVIAMLTVSFQAIKAARRNPADSIRYE
jgi:putative ABC transport system permease protein